MKRLFYHNKTLLILLFLSLIICLSYIITSNMTEAIPGIERWYIFLYDLALAYIASYMFYIVQVYIPEENLKKIKQKEELPKRYAVYKDVKVFLESLFLLWLALSKEEKYETIDELFLTKNVEQYASKIKMSESSGVLVLSLGRYIAWGEKIYSDTHVIREKGLEILRFSKRDIPIDIYFAIYYLLEEGIIINKLLYCFSIVPATKLDTLWGCIGTFFENEKKSKELENEQIKIIYKWLMHEYDYLTSQIDDNQLYTISKINCIHE